MKEIYYSERNGIDERVACCMDMQKAIFHHAVYRSTITGKVVIGNRKTYSERKESWSKELKFCPWCGEELKFVNTDEIKVGGESTFDEMKNKVNKLKVLMDDPQPGLISWHMMVGECMKYISDTWQGGIRKENSNDV